MKEPNLETCPSCNGSGEQECCDGHMCPGTRACRRCDGRGEVLSKEDAELKKNIKKLMEYR